MTAHKGLVLDANILLRAVFGQRVRQILEAYEDQVNFYAPDVCFQDARKYIPTFPRADGSMSIWRCLCLTKTVSPLSPSTEVCTRITRKSLALESFLAILTIGRLRRWHCCSAFRFGPRIRTSLAAASRPGRPTGSSYFFENSDREPKLTSIQARPSRLPGHQSLPENLQP